MTKCKRLKFVCSALCLPSNIFPTLIFRLCLTSFNRTAKSLECPSVVLYCLQHPVALLHPAAPHSVHCVQSNKALAHSSAVHLLCGCCIFTNRDAVLSRGLFVALILVCLIFLPSQLNDAQWCCSRTVLRAMVPQGSWPFREWRCKASPNCTAIPSNT